MCRLEKQCWLMDRWSNSRKVPEQCVQVAQLETDVLKVLIFRDQWPKDWNEFTQAPVKTMTTHFPPFQLRKGHRCGPECAKFHPPVDTEIDSVLADVWSRIWISSRGKKVSAETADAFQVMLRVPHICMKAIHWLSGHDGLYVKPRARDGKSPEESLAVVWLEDATYQEAVHKQKTTDRALPITRFGNRYGIRVLKKDLESVQTKLGVEEQISNVSVQKIFELRPLPFGTLKKTVQQMITKWGWAARPIQPGKSDAAGMSWKVGAEEEPPSLIMQTNNGDVAISLQKQVVAERYSGNVLSSMKTQAHLRKQSKERSSGWKGKENAAPKQTEATSSASGGANDPWVKQGTYDPWGRWNPVSNEDVPMAVTPKLDTIQDALKKEVTASVTEKTDQRLNKMEVDIYELRQQHVKYEQWFSEAGAATTNLQSQLNTVAAQVADQRSEISSMGQEIKSGFSHLEALLSKKSRTEWWCDPRPRVAQYHHGVRVKKQRQNPLQSNGSWFGRLSIFVFWIVCQITVVSADVGLDTNLGVPCVPGMKRECLPGTAVQTMSFTDEFLEAIRLRSQTVNDPPIEVGVADDHHRIELLTEFPGDRRFRMYRPNPFRVQRPSQVDFQVAEQDKVEDPQTHSCCLARPQTGTCLGNPDSDTPCTQINSSTTGQGCLSHSCSGWPAVPIPSCSGTSWKSSVVFGWQGVHCWTWTDGNPCHITGRVTAQPAAWPNMCRHPLSSQGQRTDIVAHEHVPLRPRSLCHHCVATGHSFDSGGCRRHDSNSN